MWQQEEPMLPTGLGNAGEDSRFRLLEDSLNAVREHSYTMCKAIAVNNVRDVLKHAAALISELRTSSLGPRQYHELYLEVCRELRHLIPFFLHNASGRLSFEGSDAETAVGAKEVAGRRRLLDFYESVQHAGNVLPRLYLLIIVAAACIKERELPAREVLADLNDLCGGVQHPLRGLFLRHYLVQSMKDCLPDAGDPDFIEWAQSECNALDPSCASDEPQAIVVRDEEHAERSRDQQGEMSVRPKTEEHFSTVDLSFKFLLDNCTEATKLWTRLQFQPSAAISSGGSGPKGDEDEEKAQLERQYMKALVGANILRMAHLKCLTSQYFSQRALPEMADFVKRQRNPAAQQYLIECIVQAFPDEYHLNAIGPLMNLVVAASSYVNPQPALKTLFMRLASFLAAAEDEATEARLAPEGRERSPALELERIQPKSDFRDAVGVCKTTDLSALHAVDTSENGDAGSDGREGGFPAYREAQSLRHEGSGGAPHTSITASPIKSIPMQKQHAFTTIREALMDIIQKAHDENFCAPSAPLSTSKSSKKSVKTSAPYCLTIPNILSILSHFLDLTMTIFPSQARTVDSVFQLVYPLVKSLDSCANRLQGPTATRNLAVFLSTPFTRPAYACLLHCTHFSSILSCLTDMDRRAVTVAIVRSLSASGGLITDVATASRLYEVLSVIIQSADATAIKKEAAEVDLDLDPPTLLESIAAAAHLLHNDDTDSEIDMLLNAKTLLLSGATQTLAVTLPPLVIRLLSLVPRVLARELAFERAKAPTMEATAHSDDGGADALDVTQGPVSRKREEVTMEGDAPPPTPYVAQPPGNSSRRILQEIHSGCCELSSAGATMQAIRLLLMAADESARADVKAGGNFGAICHEFLKQAMVTYEEDFVDDREKAAALPLFVGCIRGICAFRLEADAYDALAAKLTRHSAKLLRSSDQCRAILACTHIFWNEHMPEKSDFGRVCECLQRCLKLAVGAHQFSSLDAVLFADILEKYLFFTECGPETGGVGVERLSNLIALCLEQLDFAVSALNHASEGAKATVEEARASVLRTVRYIRKVAGSPSSRLAGVAISYPTSG